MTPNTTARIDVTHSVTVNQPIDSAFSFFSDLRRDKECRKEINATNVTGYGLNTTAVEDSFLSKRVPHHLTKLRCTAYHNKQKAVYETYPEDRFFLRSTRSAEAISATQTRLTYQLEFDKAVVKHGLGFTLPGFLVSYVTRSAMKNYLAKLKELVEAPVAV